MRERTPPRWHDWTNKWCGGGGRKKSFNSLPITIIFRKVVRQSRCRLNLPATWHELIFTVVMSFSGPQHLYFELWHAPVNRIICTRGLLKAQFYHNLESSLACSPEQHQVSILFDNDFPFKIKEANSMWHSSPGVSAVTNSKMNYSWAQIYLAVAILTSCNEKWVMWVSVNTLLCGLLCSNRTSLLFYSATDRKVK